MALSGIARQVVTGLVAGEAPGEGAGVLDAEVHAAPAHRRVHVRRVAAEERAAGLVGRRLLHRNVEAVAAQPAGDAVAAGNACQGIGRVGAGAEAARAEGDDEADVAVGAPEEVRDARLVGPLGQFGLGAAPFPPGTGTPTGNLRAV